MSPEYEFVEQKKEEAGSLPVQYALQISSRCLFLYLFLPAPVPDSEAHPPSGSPFSGPSLFDYFQTTGVEEVK